MSAEDVQHDAGDRGHHQLPVVGTTGVAKAILDAQPRPGRAAARDSPPPATTGLCGSGTPTPRYVWPRPMWSGAPCSTWMSTQCVVRLRSRPALIICLGCSAGSRRCTHLTPATCAGPTLAAHPSNPLLRSQSPTYTSATRDNRPDGAQLWPVSRLRDHPAPRRLSAQLRACAPARLGGAFRVVKVESRWGSNLRTSTAFLLTPGRSLLTARPSANARPAADVRT